jgi:hypothetical protein
MIIKDAILSNDGVHRYNLIREWDAINPSMLFVMLNPSTADAVEDDPTIRRCMGFARRENCGMIEVVNLFAYRATDPKELKKTDTPLVGADNDEIIQLAAEESDIIVCAWGTNGTLNGRNKEVISLLQSVGKPIMCLGKTKDGHPKHPLYLPADAELIEL